MCVCEGEQKREIESFFNKTTHLKNESYRKGRKKLSVRILSLTVSLSSLYELFLECETFLHIPTSLFFSVLTVETSDYIYYELYA